jgi:hypothetical protein
VKEAAYSTLTVTAMVFSSLLVQEYSTQFSSI